MHNVLEIWATMAELEIWKLVTNVSQVNICTDVVRGEMFMKMDESEVYHM